MASIIAAAPVPGVSFSGVAPAAGILSVKITNSDTFPGSVAAQAIVTAVDDGAEVINLSLATVSTPALAAAVRFAQASNVVVVAAAGNDSPDGATGPFYPAAYPGVLSVGAVGQDGARAGFSDTRTPVSVTAPGVGVTAAYPGVFPRAYNPASNGTSFATAFVSGVASLVRAAHPGLDQAQVVARITATANGSAGPGTGHGLVNPVQAVTAILPAISGGLRRRLHRTRCPPGPRHRRPGRAPQPARPPPSPCPSRPVQPPWPSWSWRPPWSSPRAAVATGAPDRPDPVSGLRPGPWPAGPASRPPPGPGIRGRAPAPSPASAGPSRRSRPRSLPPGSAPRW